MKRGLWIAALVLGVGLVSGPKTADAALITVTFDELALGVWDGAFYDSLGVHFDAPLAGTDLVVRDIFGQRVLSTSPFDLQPISAIFLAAPTNFVRIENIINGRFSSEIDVITVTAFDIFNNVIATVTQSPGDQFLIISTLGFDIARVTFDDVEGTWGSGYVMENFTFNQVSAVPEPSTVVFLGVGLSALWLRMRKKG